MRDMVSTSDHKDGSGKVDWTAYYKAQVDNGQRCYRCGAYIVFGNGHRRLCLDCETMQGEPDAVSHDRYVRCPYCRHGESVDGGDLYHLYEDGTHEVTCSMCGKEFTVTTSVSYSFESPALCGDGEGEDE